MPFLNDAVFDNGLSELSTNGTRVDITSAEATTYTEAITTFSLGNKTAHTITAPADRTGGGRKVTSPEITDGSVTATNTATHWAITDGVSVLLATGTLSASQGVTSGNTFTLSTFDIGIPDPV